MRDLKSECLTHFLLFKNGIVRTGCRCREFLCPARHYVAGVPQKVVDFLCEIVRVVNSSPKWEPGMQRQQPVRVKYTLPVVFQIKN